jgi:sulfate transport system permease protein
MYGVILTNARAMGEFGAVSVISGNIIGRTQTLTLFVESAYKARPAAPPRSYTLP